MKFSKPSQLFLVSRVFIIPAIGLVLATLLTACQIVTIDYVFVADSAGTVNRKRRPDTNLCRRLPVGRPPAGRANRLFRRRRPGRDCRHGQLLPPLRCQLRLAKTLSTSPSPPTACSPSRTRSSLPAAPVSIAVNSANNYLYVVLGTTSATLNEYPITIADGTIGAATAQIPLTLPAYPGDTIVPTGVNVLANNNDVYVAAYDASAYNPGGSPTSAANPGWVFGFAVGSGGALTPAPGSPYKAGVKPSGIASDPVNRFVYITDFASNELIGFTIQSGGALNFMVNGPFKSGNQPSSVVVDPRGIYIYVSDSLDSSITAYSIALPTGSPSAIVNSNSSLVYATDTQPVAITIDPALGRFVYTVNHLGNSVSGFRLSPDTGVVTQTQATPYPTAAGPTALVLVPHGNHSVQAVTP